MAIGQYLPTVGVTPTAQTPSYASPSLQSPTNTASIDGASTLPSYNNWSTPQYAAPSVTPWEAPNGFYQSLMNYMGNNQAPALSASQFNQPAQTYQPPSIGYTQPYGTTPSLAGSITLTGDDDWGNDDWDNSWGWWGDPDARPGANVQALPDGQGSPLYLFQEATPDLGRLDFAQQHAAFKRGITEGKIDLPYTVDGWIEYINPHAEQLG